MNLFRSSSALSLPAKAAAFLPLLCFVTGCHSAFIQATVVNNTGRAIHLFEVDYPNASFGSGELAPGQQFHYRFKVLDTGATKLVWTDAAGQEHTAAGPDLHQGLEGTLSILIGPTGTIWQPHLHQVP